MALIDTILAARRAGRPLLALLLDPEKPFPVGLDLRGPVRPDMLLVGGSTGGDTTPFVRRLRTLTELPVVLFPGSGAQFTEEADALLYLSLLSGDNPALLNGEQIRAARRVRRSGIETIPMGYILVDGGVETSVMRVSGTQPIAQTEVAHIVDVAIAAQLMGKQLVYLEAGSGARVPVSEEIIRAVRAEVDIPIIVGGGIRTPEAMHAAFQAGADLVVIGNHFEHHPEDLALFTK